MAVHKSTEFGEVEISLDAIASLVTAMPCASLSIETEEVPNHLQ